jgi:hypothetical protein
MTEGKLIIQQAILSPSVGFMAPLSDGTRDEQAELTTVVRNLGDTDIVLNATRLEVIRSRTLKIQGGTSAADVLQDTIGDSSPIVVRAGQTARVTFGDLINLEGVISAVEREDNLDEATLIGGLPWPAINGRQYVDRFSFLMSRLYGSQAALRATYFTRDYQTAATIEIPLKKSAGYFYNGEVFDRKTGRHVFQPLPAYDAFLGGYLKQKEIWVPGFKIREPEHRCIDMISDASVPGGWTSREVRCGNKNAESASTPQSVKGRIDGSQLVNHISNLE